MYRRRGGDYEGVKIHVGEEETIRGSDIVYTRGEGWH